MKKFGVILLLALLVVSFGFVVAVEPSVPGGINGSKVDEINKLQEDYSPLNKDGDFNFSKYAPFKSKAEERIEAINTWIADNASWLSIVFGMVPEISWLFAINLYVLLFFFMSLFLNGDTMWVFLSDKKAKLFGLGVFAVLTVTKFFLNVLVLPSYNFWLFVFEYGWWAMTLFWIVLIVLIVFFPRVLRKIRASIKIKMREKAREKEKMDREVLHAAAEGISESG